MNALIEQTEQALRAKTKAQGIDKTVDAGEKIMFSEGGAQLFHEQIQKDGDIIENAAEGVAKLIAILFDQSKKTMPLDTAVASAAILMLRGLDFLEEAGRIEITPEVVAQATKAMAGYVLQVFGVTPEMLQKMQADAGGAAAAGPARPGGGLLAGAMQGGA